MVLYAKPQCTGTVGLDMICLEHAIMEIKSHKSSGPDQISDEFVRPFKLCFSLGYFPSAWNIGNLITILEAPDKHPGDSKSLRPITLLPELGKILERIITYALLSGFPENELFHDSQYGFRAGKSMIKAPDKLISHVRSASIKISGAFDNICGGRSQSMA
ncbi:hypothetical protein JTB14_023377 [Gonioctena quinquepunctata]|nr:hypothetical protein JTB14_023377 [Gonioctena quinquepunctata]